MIKLRGQAHLITMLDDSWDPCEGGEEVGIGDFFKGMVYGRTGLSEKELVCPREQSDMTPCVARDGDLAMTKDGKCVGCQADVQQLIKDEKKKHHSGIPMKEVEKRNGLPIMKQMSSKEWEKRNQHYTERKPMRKAKAGDACVSPVKQKKEKQ